MKNKRNKLFMTLLSGIMLIAISAGCGKMKEQSGEEPPTVTDAENTVEIGENLKAETNAEVKTPLTDDAENAPVVATETEATVGVATGTENTGGEVIVYFANWDIYQKGARGEVANIPWEDIAYVNHAFWAVTPEDGTTETSFARREKGAAARTQFKIVSTDAEADYLTQEPSAVDASLASNHFAEYEYFSRQYPAVNIMISIGGWSRCGYFSEMAYTEAGRRSFIDSCLDLMAQYPWIDGMDIDWEYPAGNQGGERAPESPDDEGCPIWGTAAEDNTNFALLLEELRAAMDEKYGAGVKKLTACASASYAWTLPCQDWAAAEPYLNFINIMTYDFTGSWAGMTGHNSSLADAEKAVAFLLNQNIPAEKLNIGSPMYGMDLKMTTINPTAVLGTAIQPVRPSQTEIDQGMIRQFKAEALSGYTLKEENGKVVLDSSFHSAEAGWHFAYDEQANAPYLYNNDENSAYGGWFISYEDELSLQAKLDLIRKLKLAGIIVWECGQDTADYQLITRMGAELKARK